MEKFVSFFGIGIKIVVCVLFFCLCMLCFVVDIYVYKFCCWFGWMLVKVDFDNVFCYGDFMVLDYLKYGLYQLFICYGQICFKCRKNIKFGIKDWFGVFDCLFEYLFD